MVNPDICFKTDIKTDNKINAGVPMNKNQKVQNNL